MFADACSRASKFVRPVIISTRRRDGTVEASCGTFLVINDEGWIITAGHLYDKFVKFHSDSKKKDYDSSDLINHSFWWGWDGVYLTNVYVNRQIDIAIGKLEPFDPAWVKEYPVFKDPEALRPGTSLCRLGFPFTDVVSDFDEEMESFKIQKGVFPMLLFPNEGMHTRNVYKGKSKDGNYDMLYVETSTPGLRGQSGGPIYDRECRICGIQVQTAHLPLGFQPAVEYEGKTVVENQFLNVGLGVHVKTLLKILEDRNIKFRADREFDNIRY